APRRAASVRRPWARSSSTSCDACQKNRYGEIVVPKMPTSVAMNSRSNLISGVTVARSTVNQSGLARNPARMYVKSTAVNDFRYAAKVAYDVQIVTTTMAVPTTGTNTIGGSPVSSVATSATPLGSAAMLNKLAGSSRRREAEGEGEVGEGRGAGGTDEAGQALPGDQSDARTRELNGDGQRQREDRCPQRRITE